MNCYFLTWQPSLVYMEICSFSFMQRRSTSFSNHELSATTKSRRWPLMACQQSAVSSYEPVDNLLQLCNGVKALFALFVPLFSVMDNHCTARILAESGRLGTNRMREWDSHYVVKEKWSGPCNRGVAPAIKKLWSYETPIVKVIVVCLQLCYSSQIGPEGKASVCTLIETSIPPFKLVEKTVAI